MEYKVNMKRFMIIYPDSTVCVQVVERCAELGGQDGQYEYVAADMGSISDAERVIRVLYRHKRPQI